MTILTAKQTKILTLLFLTLTAGVWFWFRLSLIFTAKDTNASHLIWFGVSFLIFIIFLLISFLVLETLWLILILSILIAANFFLFFSFQPFYLVGLVLLIVASLLAYLLIQFEKRNRLKIAYWKIWKRGLPPILTVIVLIIAIIYYFNPLLKISQHEINISPKIIGLLLKPAGNFLGTILPFYNPKMTVDQLIAMSLMTGSQGQISPELLSPEIIQKLQEKGVRELDVNQILKDPEITKLIEKELQAEVKKMDQKILARQRNELSKSLGIQVQGNETLDVLISQLLNSKFKDFIGPYAKEISLGIVVALFFFLRFLFIPFGWLAILLAWLLFKILILLKIFRIEKIMKEGEEIKF